MARRFEWQSQGLVFCPDGRYPWMNSHAQNPTALDLSDRLRVFFTCRPERDINGNFAAVTTFVDLDRRDPSRVLRVHDRPILELGAPGSFDQFGVMPGAVIRKDGVIWLYYVGWMRTNGVPYTHSIGVAVSHDDGDTFERLGTGPVITRNLLEPYLQNSPTVFLRDGEFNMFYSSGIEWIHHEGRWESVYVLMRAVSRDGITWQRTGVPCVPRVVDKECQTNPTIIELDGLYHMWFCYRYGLSFRNKVRGYRIGYAWSEDLSVWHREDDSSRLSPSNKGWDSEMLCYPNVIRIDGRYVLFYSGNDCGRDGFGYAVLSNQ